MDPDALRTQLAQLHAELGSVKQVDARSAELLGDIMQDIKRLVDQAPKAAPGTGSSRPSLTTRLEHVAVQFEADHPTLAASSRRLVDLLAKAGL